MAASAEGSEDLQRSRCTGRHDLKPPPESPGRALLQQRSSAGREPNYFSDVAGREALTVVMVSIQRRVASFWNWRMLAAIA
jgi:hypothetical protein